MNEQMKAICLYFHFIPITPHWSLQLQFNEGMLNAKHGDLRNEEQIHLTGAGGLGPQVVEACLRDSAA